MILDFCLDICLFLIHNTSSVAVIHCKAGKGRSGLMIICYMLFLGLFENAEEAQAYYAKRRSEIGSGLTLNSQKRYASYFQQFLQNYFPKPYVSCLQEYEENKNFFSQKQIENLKRKLSLKFVLIGPFKIRTNLMIHVEIFKKFNNKVNLIDLQLQERKDF